MNKLVIRLTKSVAFTLLCLMTKNLVIFDTKLAVIQVQVQDFDIVILAQVQYQTRTTKRIVRT